MGVYIVRNRNTGKAYVGGSTWVEQRLAQHRCMMADGCHPNPRLLGAVKRSGIRRFEFKCVEVVSDIADLAARELAWIKRLDAVDNGYNRTYRTEHYHDAAPPTAASNRREPWDNSYGLWSRTAKITLVAGAAVILILVF